MKIISSISLVLGLMLTMFGTIPFIFRYPYSNSANSGPSNAWELVLMLSYDVKGWSLFIGIVLLVLFFSINFKQRNWSFKIYDYLL